ncbi:VCBS domain-containing protein [Budviciaceae bacterium BWR-B9]|uniref:VCBS domain-containing protein n=1 Tax=Limnobaculum allomyrinae TaxID=2791986 RepID=A0ABS1IW39_9GAMM|nr:MULTISPECIES: VCBS domain-containing protein [Limnobaculum]MBK5145959.1 VCBS domain-containing protein [Limnobaculum allomyrinae]MBV7693986.1 VCBS domain-containing protein [Limnobaculum sp. M2-1]
MSNSQDNVTDLANQLAETLSQLPDDGKERQLTVTIGGSNHGTVVMGSQITINTESKRTRSPGEMRSDELYELKNRYVSEIYSARRKKWVSTPAIVMLMMMIFLVSLLLWCFSPLLSGVPLRVILSHPPVMINESILLIWVIIFAASAYFFDKIRKVQDRLIRNNKEYIESIDVELSRKSS